MLQDVCRTKERRRKEREKKAYLISRHAMLSYSRREDWSVANQAKKKEIRIGIGISSYLWLHRPVDVLFWSLFVICPALGCGLQATIANTARGKTGEERWIKDVRLYS